MALQVWLPLTKDLRNQGLSNVTVTNNGATFNSAGKLGGCYQFNASGYLKETSFNWSNFNTSEFSICCWYKEPSPVASGNSQMICIGTSSGWNNIRIGLLRRTSNGYPMFSVSDGTNNVNYNFTADSFTLDTWNHIVCTYNNGTMKMYLNGILHKTATTTIVPALNSSQHLGIGAASNGSEKLTGYLNDVRIYDHCLSPMEVKKLSQGLVLHYPLNDNSIQQMNNCYVYPRFETSSSSGGWSHWGRSGASGSSGQSTDSNYIYRSGQTYTHWVANASTATGEYLLYQSPAFEGGSRSLQCICKETNGKIIDESIVFPNWNARSGGTVLNKWTSITSLGNGFYLCKCEDIQQDGSNDLVGFYVRPGYKVYFSEAYLENDRECCSDIFYPTNIIYDTSGFCNNSILNTSTTISTDTAKYAYSTYFGAYNTPKTDINDTSLLSALTNCSIAWWAKTDVAKTLFFTGQDGSHYVMASNNNNFYHQNAGSPTIYRDGVVGTYKNEAGVWHHYVMTGVNISSWTQFRINSYSSWPLNGLVSDVRIYATALSASDVKSLYQNCATIDPDGTIHGQIR